MPFTEVHSQKCICRLKMVYQWYSVWTKCNNLHVCWDWHYRDTDFLACSTKLLSL